MEMDQKTIIIIVIVVIVIFVLFLLSKMGSPSSKLRKGVVAPKMKIPINTFPITNALQSIVGQNLNIFPMEENKPPNSQGLADFGELSRAALAPPGLAMPNSGGASACEPLTRPALGLRR